MSDTVETAPPAVRRDRSVEARRAARQAKASRERRIIESLNRGVSVAVIAEWEDVGEKRMRALVRDILARRMPEPPAQFLAMQVSRLKETLLVSFRRHVGVQPSGCRSRRQDRARTRSLSRFRRRRASLWPSRCARSARGNRPMARGAHRRADSPANGAAKA